MSNHTTGSCEYDVEELFEALERSVLEIDALMAIYGSSNENENDDDDNCYCKVLSKDNVIKAKAIIDTHDTTTLLSLSSSSSSSLLQFDIELQIPIESTTTTLTTATTTTTTTTTNTNTNNVRIQFGLPLGYPLLNPICNISIISIKNNNDNIMNRTIRDNIQKQLTDKAQNMVGIEVILDLIQELQDLIIEIETESISNGNNTNTINTKSNNTPTTTTTTTSSSSLITDNDDNNNTNNNNIYSRCWIWVHHITNKQRCKDIVNVANELKLIGYLKSGYPGIVLIEGINKNINEFIIWIKGNKSRPNGGFGRNWGHHVRGEITNLKQPSIKSSSSTINISEDDEKQQKQNNQLLFIHLDDDLSLLSAKCKQYNLHDEFCTYILQHTGKK